MKKLNCIIWLVAMLLCFSFLKAQEPMLMSPKLSAVGESFDISPNKNFLAIAFFQVQLLDIKTGRLVKKFSNESAFSVCFSPDGKTIATTNNYGKSILILDIISGKILNQYNDSLACGALCYSSDGKSLAYYSGKYLKIWNLNSGLHRIIDESEKKHFYLGEGKAYSHDLRYSKSGDFLIASGVYIDDIGANSLKIFETKNYKQYKTFDNNIVIDFDLSTDNNLIAILEKENRLKIENFNNGKILIDITLPELKNKNDGSGRDKKYNNIRFSPNDSKLLISCLDDNIYDKSNILIYDLSNNNFPSELELYANKVSFLENEKIIAAHVRKGLTIWDIVNKELVQNFNTDVKFIENFYLSGDSKKILILPHNENMRVYDKYFTKIKVLEDSYYKSYTNAIIPETSQQIITCGGRDYYIWDSESGILMDKRENILENTWDKVLSDDGKYLFQHSGGGCHFSYFDINSGSQLYRFKTYTGWEPPIYCACFSPNNKYIATGVNTRYDLTRTFAQGSRELTKEEQKRAVSIWDLSTGNLVRTFPTDHPVGKIQNIKFSRDGNFIFTDSNNEENICQWDLNGNLIKTFKGRIRDVSKSGKYIISFIKTPSSWSTVIYDIITSTPICSVPSSGKSYLSNDDSILYINTGACIQAWDVKTSSLLFSYYINGEDDWVAVSPKGYFDGTKEGIKLLHYTKDLEIITIESTFEEFYTPNLINIILSGGEIKSSFQLSKLQSAASVKIISPQNNFSSSDESIVLQIEVKDNGGGIDEIALYQNGKLIENTSRGFKSIQTTEGKFNHSFIVHLSDGINILKAVAFNNQRTESLPDEIKVSYKATKSTKPSMFIFAIGINEYLNPRYKLNYATNDAKAFASALKEGASLIFENIYLTTLFNEQTSKASILSSLEDIKLKIKPEDVFIFYFAGHGVMSSGNTNETPEFYLLPYDITKMFDADEMLKLKSISAKEIGEFSKNISSQKQLFVLDACQSGGAVQSFAMRGAAEEKAIAQLSRSTGTYFIAASGTEQFASEVATLGHGIFTYSLIEAIKGACKSQDGRLTVNLLKGCVEDMVPELSKKYKGSPQFPTGYGYGQDFPIVIIK